MAQGLCFGGVRVDATSSRVEGLGQGTGGFAVLVGFRVVGGGRKESGRRV